MTTEKHDDANALRFSGGLEAVAYVLFLETWLYDDEGLADLSEELLQNIGKKWHDEWLPKRNAEHCGDCNKVSCTCIRCALDGLFSNAKRILASNVFYPDPASSAANERDDA